MWVFRKIIQCLSIPLENHHCEVNFGGKCIEIQKLKKKSYFRLPEIQWKSAQLHLVIIIYVMDIGRKIFVGELHYKKKKIITVTCNSLMWIKLNEIFFIKKDFQLFVPCSLTLFMFILIAWFHMMHSILFMIRSMSNASSTFATRSNWSLNQWFLFFSAVILSKVNFITLTWTNWIFIQFTFNKREIDWYNSVIH